MSYQETNKADPGYAGYPFQLTLSSNGLPGRWVGGWMDGWLFTLYWALVRQLCSSMNHFSTLSVHLSKLSSDCPKTCEQKVWTAGHYWECLLSRAPYKAETE